MAKSATTTRTVQPRADIARITAAAPCDPGSSEPFDDGGVGETAALAHRLQAVAAAGALELVEQRGHETRTGAAERVAERDRAAVHVHTLHVGVVLLRPREDDGCERLVDLDEVDVVEGEAGALEHLRGRRDRRGEHE